MTTPPEPSPSENSDSPPAPVVPTLPPAPEQLAAQVTTIPASIPLAKSEGQWVMICRATDIEDGGNGVRFPVERSVRPSSNEQNGFVIRFDGQVYGYLNECAHVPVELDWNEGQFFDDSGLYLLCATHGAAYEPESGYCVAGPCAGRKLRSIAVAERDGAIYWQTDRYLQAPQTESSDSAEKD